MITFIVAGVPRPQGSYTWSPNANGKARVFGSKASLLWRERVAAAAEREMGGRPLLAGAVLVALVFRLPRPQAHYGTGRNAEILKDSAPHYPTTTPDTDKLERAILDALTATVLVDDAQVTKLIAEKVYSTSAEAGVTVEVVELEQVSAADRVEPQLALAWEAS